MALYLEVGGLFNDSDLLERVEVATIIAANGLADNVANNAWVSQAYSSPTVEAKKVLRAVLATHNGLTAAQIQEATYNGLTVAQIQEPTDAALQTAVDNAVAVLVKAVA